MPVKAIARRNNFRRFIQSLLLGAAGSALTTAAAQAQACTATGGGTFTVGPSNPCSSVTLGGGTSLLVPNGVTMTNAGTMVSTVSASGNITVNGVINQTATDQDIMNLTRSVGSITFGVGSNISTNSAAIATFSSFGIGSFTNSGTVKSAGSAGVILQNTNGIVRGDVINDKDGVSTSPSYFFSLVNGTVTGSVINNGSITTTNTATSGSGFRFQGSGTGFTTIQGNIVNNGQISGSDGVNQGFLIIKTNIGGSLINDAKGRISGYRQGAVLDTVTINGSLINEAGGKIDGSSNAGSNGLSLTTVTATSLENRGSIKAGSAGIIMSGGTFGSLLNSGTIEASNGILSSGANYNGAFTNSGAINSLATGITLSAGTVKGDVTNAATGTITTTAATGTNLGINATNVAITGSLINDGTITGGGSAGAGRTGVNLSGGSITGDVKNNGTIKQYTNGLSIASTPITGSVINGATGDINATGVGVNLSGVTAASLQNLGAITAVTQGVNISGGKLGDYSTARRSPRPARVMKTTVFICWAARSSRAI